MIAGFKKIKNELGETSTHLFKTFFIYGLIALSIIITKVLIARLYGQEELGIFSYFFGLVSVVFLFTSFGLPEAVTQTIVKEPFKLKNSLRYALIFIIPITFLVLLPFLLTDFFLASNLKVSFLLYIITYTLFYFTYSVFRGYRKFSECSWYSLVNRLLFIVFIFLLAAKTISFSYVLLSLSLALLLTALISLPRLFSLWRKSFPSVSVNLREFLTLAFSLFLMQSGFYLLREMDLVIIPYLVDFTQLGLYSAHASFSNVIRLIAYVFPVVVLPLAAINHYKLRQSFLKIIKLLLPFSLVVLLATYLFVPIFYGPQYKDQFLPLALVLSSALLVVYSYLSSVFVGENKFSRPYFKILLLDFLLSLLLNTGLLILFIHYFGLIGAPLATSLTVALKILLNIYGIKKLRLENKRLEINSAVIS